MSNQRLKSKGLKVTLPRLKVLSFLETSRDRHLSAEDIYKAMSQQGAEVSLATIYRVLSQFEAAQIITRHRFEGDHSVFELKDVDPHDHFVCESCGLVKEVSDEALSSAKQSVAESLGFQVSDHSLCIYGLCPDCQKLV